MAPLTLEQIKENAVCLFEFKTVVVTVNTRMGEPFLEVNCGFFTLGTRYECGKFWPVTVHNLAAAESVRMSKADIRKMEGGGNLNWPDIQHHFTQLFNDICSQPEDKRDSQYNALSEFTQGLRSKLSDARFEEIQGVKIFGR